MPVHGASPVVFPYSPWTEPWSGQRRSVDLRRAWGSGCFWCVGGIPWRNHRSQTATATKSSPQTWCSPIPEPSLPDPSGAWLDCGHERSVIFSTASALIACFGEVSSGKIQLTLPYYWQNTINIINTVIPLEAVFPRAVATFSPFSWNFRSAFGNSGRESLADGYLSLFE